jgi:UDP-glucuronate decarboxylase
MADKTVLVTGAGGFVGRQTLQPLLDLGYEVHAISRHPRPDMPHVQWHSCNLLDTAATDALLAKIHPPHLLHIAWYAEHGKFWTAPENTTWLEASTHLFEKFISLGGQRIVGVGTCAEYGWRRQFQIPWKETDPCHPQTPYGQAKLALLNRLAAFHANYAWARIFMLFGPDESPNRLVPYTIRTALAGEDLLCTEGSQIRDLIDTRICGRALAQLFASDVTGPVNIGSGEPISVSSLIKQICTLCDYTGNIKFGAVTMNKTDPFFMVPDLLRLRNEVKFTEQQDTRQSLSEMIAWWRKNSSR